MLRALSYPVLVSSILLAPLAYGSSLQPGPYGSAPSDKSFILTFDSLADGRSSYVVDSKGFYENGFGPTTSGTRLGGIVANDGAGNIGFLPASVSANAFNSKGATGGPAGSFSGVAGFFSSGGGEISSIGSIWGGAELSGFKGLVEGAGSAAGKKGLGLSGILLDSGSGLAPGSKGDRDIGGSVSATPLPASWTMMFIGLAAFGLLAWFRKPKTSKNRPRRVSLAAK